MKPLPEMLVNSFWRHAAVEVARVSRRHPKMPASPTSGNHKAMPSRSSALPLPPYRREKMDKEMLERRAREQARMDMREDAPHNPYPYNSIQYWAYVREVNKSFTEELRRSI